jgi:polyisoprenoid-binding protein YceI
MIRARSAHPRLRRTLAAALFASLATATYASAQSRWTVDPKSSLVWYQMNPHLNHLWATTCPEEPSWRPGDGRSSGWTVSQGFRAPKGGYQGSTTGDTARIPLYPRPKVRSVCNPQALRGSFVVGDTTTLRGVRGEVVVKADAIITASDDRDAYTRSAILQTTRYPEIRFAIDSIVRVTRRADTLTGTAVGALTIREVTRPMTAGVKAYPVAGGIRVLAKFRTPAQDLVPEWGLSRFALGLGVGVRIWEDLYMGADLVVRPDEGE